MPLQVALARQNLDCMDVGAVDGTVCVYHCATGELVHHLGHKVKGRIQVINVSDPFNILVAMTTKFLGSKHT